MLEKVSQMAEQVVTSVSRRQFLGQFGARAAALAAAVGGLLALPTMAHGGKPPPAACGNHSDIECNGSLPGDPCDYQGTCRRIRGTSDCYCWFKGKP